jgi:hypothetical protein
MLVFDLVRLPAPGWAQGPVAQWESVRFTRGRSLVRSQPGPLGESPVHRAICLLARATDPPQRPRLSAVYPQSRSAAESVERIRHTIEVGVVEVCVGVCGHHDRRVAHRHLQFHVGTRRSSQRRVGCPSSAILVRSPPPVSSFDSEPRALRELDGGPRQHGRACRSSTAASPNEAQVDHFEARSSAGDYAASSSGSSKIWAKTQRGPRRR